MASSRDKLLEFIDLYVALNDEYFRRKSYAQQREDFRAACQELSVLKNLKIETFVTKFNYDEVFIAFIEEHLAVIPLTDEARKEVFGEEIFAWFIAQVGEHYKETIPPELTDPAIKQEKKNVVTPQQHDPSEIKKYNDIYLSAMKKRRDALRKDTEDRDVQQVDDTSSSPAVSDVVEAEYQHDKHGSSKDTVHIVDEIAPEAREELLAALKKIDLSKRVSWNLHESFHTVYLIVERLKQVKTENALIKAAHDLEFMRHELIDSIKNPSLSKEDVESLKKLVKEISEFIGVEYDDVPKKKLDKVVLTHIMSDVKKYISDLLNDLPDEGSCRPIKEILNKLNNILTDKTDCSEYMTFIGLATQLDHASDEMPDEEQRTLVKGVLPLVFGAMNVPVSVTSVDTMTEDLSAVKPMLSTTVDTTPSHSLVKKVDLSPNMPKIPQERLASPYKGYRFLGDTSKVIPRENVPVSVTSVDTMTEDLSAVKPMLSTTVDTPPDSLVENVDPSPSMPKIPQKLFAHPSHGYRFFGDASKVISRENVANELEHFKKIGEVEDDVVEVNVARTVVPKQGEVRVNTLTLDSGEIKSVQSQNNNVTKTEIFASNEIKSPEELYRTALVIVFEFLEMSTKNKPTLRLRGNMSDALAESIFAVCARKGVGCKDRRTDKKDQIVMERYQKDNPFDDFVGRDEIYTKRFTNDDKLSLRGNELRRRVD